MDSTPRAQAVALSDARFSQVQRTGPHKTRNRLTDFFKNFRSRNDIYI